MSTPPTAPDTGRDAEEVLYEKRQKIYPREVHGLFAYLRTAGVIVLLGLFYGVAWLQWDGRQAVLWDLPARKFYVWGLVLWPQDFIYLAFLLILAGFALFFFTTLAGRLWCGYACPQTVWTESFLWIERLVEGDRPKQMKLDREPWSARKLGIKGTKHFLWITFALWTGFMFVGYFTPIRELGANLLAGSAGPWATFWVCFYAFATYGNAGWMREQVCKYMCPYARFQSAMFDKDTLVVSYDPRRGEPRGSRRRSIDHRAAGLGDCIDCGFCVQVCPTGIDIRKGLQYECISCSACIDACDSVMDTMGYAKGLISYTTQHALEGAPTRVLRPRVFVYAALLVAFSSGLAWNLLHRLPLGLDVIRDRNQLYRETEDGMIENVYTLKVMNMDRTPHRYELAARGIDGLALKLEHPVISAEPGEVRNVVARLQAGEDDLNARSTPVWFTLTASGDDRLEVTEEARFLGPAP